MSETDFGVFINCPFDEDYAPLFEALVFTINSSGYRVRCALEENDSGDLRFDKLCRLISQSRRSVHDLSGVELGDGGLPRFNMPFGYGLYLGARKFGAKNHREKTALAMVRERFRLPEYLLDAAGSDPECHHGKVEEVIRIVRRYLAVRPDGSPLPGTARIIAGFKDFQAALPQLAAGFHISATEIDPLVEYRDYMSLLTAYLKQV